jgi:hypothetical protein
MANVDITITIDSKATNAISTGKSVVTQDRVTITDTVDVAVLQEYIDHVTPKP